MLFAAHAEGQVLIDGVDMTLLDAGWYRSRVGVVDQQPRLFSLTVKENILYGCPFRWAASRAEQAVNRGCLLAVVA